MKTWIKALGIAGLLTSSVALADAVIFSGNDVKTLKPNIDLYGQSKILSGSVDPTSSAQSAPVGSIYLNTSNGNLYRKVDAGPSTNWQKVGSAAVAGNLLPNPDWETSSSGWTASGGTYARTTTAADVGFGAGSGSWDASASSQTLTSTAVAIPTGLYASNGLARCYFKTAATDYVLQAYDGTNVLASATIPASTQYQQYGVNFPFPSSGSVSLRVVSASDAAVIYMDDCYVGPAANLQSVNQSQAIGRWSGSTTALGVGATTVVFPTTNFSVDSGMNTSTGIYTVSKSGYYVISAYLTTGGTVGTGRMAMSLVQTGSASATIEFGQMSKMSSTSSDKFTVGSVTVYALTGDTLKIQAQDADGNALQGRSFVTMHLFPSNSELAYRPDQVAWRVDANISGANPSLGTSNVSSYSEITDASLALTQNSGSIATQIACASGTASSGSTCTAANESVGVAFTAPSAGAVLACASFTHYLSSPVGGADQSFAVFQIVETTNTSSAVLQEGNSRITSASVPTSAAGQQAIRANPLRVCGVLNFASSGLKTIRLEREQLFGTAPAEHLLYADAAANVGQRDIHWEVYPITQSIPAPLLVGSVTSSSAGLERVERVNVRSNCTSSPCTINESTPGISSVTRSGTGVYSINFVAGTFSGIPTCAVGTGGGANVAAPGVGHSSTVFRVDTLLFNGLSADGFIYANCQGPR